LAEAAVGTAEVVMAAGVAVQAEVEAMAAEAMAALSHSLRRT
jgi:hypothetical protein